MESTIGKSIRNCRFNIADRLALLKRPHGIKDRLALISEKSDLD